MTKQLFSNKYFPDYQVKDPKTFAKSHAKELKHLKSANVEIEGILKVRPIEVLKVIKPSLKWDKKEKLWLFNATVNIKVLDE